MVNMFINIRQNLSHSKIRMVDLKIKLSSYRFFFTVPSGFCPFPKNEREKKQPNVNRTSFRNRRG